MITKKQKLDVYSKKKYYISKKGIAVPQKIISNWNSEQVELLHKLCAKENRRREFPKQKTLRATIKQRSLSHSMYIQVYKECVGCEECGNKNLKHYQLDLDHVDPNTKHTRKSRKAVFENWSMDRIEEELSHCRVLCKNCHSKKTYENKDYCPSERHKDNRDVHALMTKCDVMRLVRFISSRR